VNFYVYFTLLAINVPLLSDKRESFAELETYYEQILNFYNHDATSILLKIPFSTPNMIIHMLWKKYVFIYINTYNIYIYVLIKNMYFSLLLKIVILKFFTLTKKYRIIYIYNQLKIYVTYISFYFINLFIYKCSTCTPTCNFLQGSYLSLHISRSTTNKILRMKFLETRTVQ